MCKVGVMEWTARGFPNTVGDVFTLQGASRDAVLVRDLPVHALRWRRMVW